MEITGISYDSREVKPGHLFFSLARDAARKRANIDDALNRGARAVAVDEGVGGKVRRALRLTFPLDSAGGNHGRCAAATAPDGRGCGALFRRAQRARQPRRHHRHQRQNHHDIFVALDFRSGGPSDSGIIGTIGIFVRDEKIYHGLTTPESVDFESSLARMEREGVHDAFAEVSSIGIAEGRVDALNFSAVPFHQSRPRSSRLSRRLSKITSLPSCGCLPKFCPKSSHREPIAVVNGDDPYGRRILEATESSKIRKISFGLDRSNDAHPIHIETGINGIHGTISVARTRDRYRFSDARRILPAQYPRGLRAVGGLGHRWGGGG